MFPCENGVYCVLPTEYTERPPNTGSPPRLFCTTHPLEPPPSACAAPKTVGQLTLASIQSCQDQDNIYAPRKTHTCSTPPSTSLPYQLVQLFKWLGSSHQHQFSPAKIKAVSMCPGKPICAPLHLPQVCLQSVQLSH